MVTLSTIWLQYQTATDGSAGTRIAWLGDINGDARADLAVGTPGSDNGAGRVSIIAGRGGNWPVPPNAEAIFDSKTSFVGASGAGLGALVAPAGDVNGDGFFDYLIGDAVNKRAYAAVAPSLKNVINATGVIIHTNLGRAPLSDATIDAMSAAGRSYSNLEFDLDTGLRRTVSYFAEVARNR